jgi:hypothetical protein
MTQYVVIERDEAGGSSAANAIGAETVTTAA